MATADQFREAKKIPFKPFQFKLADGREFNVDGPDWISLTPSGASRELLYYEPTETKGRWKKHHIELRLVAELILSPDDEPAETTDGNGSIPERK